MKRLSLRGAAGLAMVMSMAPAAAFAQGTETAAADPAASDVGTGDIVVTAQRRAQKIQDIPISISAFGSEALKARGIDDLRSLSRLSPGSVFSAASEARAYVYIRGLGTRQGDPGSDMSVGISLDEVPLVQAVFSSTFPDLQRVEILKGPQGTLYGRNTTAGAVNYLTADPTSSFEGHVNLGLEERSGRKGEIVLSGPIVGDAVKARAVLYGKKQDGYMQNLTTGNYVGGTNRYGGRLKIAIEPPESNLRASLMVDYSHDDTTMPLAKAIPRTFSGLASPATLANLGTLLQTSPDPYKSYENTDGLFKRRTWIAIGKIDYDLGPVSLVSVTGYLNSKGREFYDIDNTSVDIYNANSELWTKQFSQELRLVSDPDGSLSMGGKLNWVVGAFYLHNRGYKDFRWFYGKDSLVYSLTGGPVSDYSSSQIRTESFAVFGQASYEFLPGATLTLGGRYTHDNKLATLVGQTPDALPLILQNYTTRLNPTFSSFDPRVVLDYKINPDVMVYASFSKGFKSGGFQFGGPNAVVSQVVANPERVRAYEAGFKTQWFNRRLTLNGSIWRMDYTGLQITRQLVLSTGLSNVLSNADKARTQGIDLELAASLGSGFEIGSNYAYLDAKYLKYNVGALVYDDTVMARAPKHTLTSYVQFSTSVADDYDITFRADHTYTSKFYHEPGEGNPAYGVQVVDTVQKAYSLVNLRGTVAHGQVSVSAYVRNVFDKTYADFVQLLGNSSNTFRGEPRTFGLETTLKF